MSAILSRAARRLLEQAGCSEIADDYVILGSTDLRILLCKRAVEDLNAQARDSVDDKPDCRGIGSGKGVA